MKRNPCGRIALLLAALAATPLALADGAVLVKGGAMRLSDDRQLIDNRLSSIDEDSTRTFAVAFEHRTRRGVAFGVEYLSHRHDFTNAVTTEPGDLRIQVLQFIAKKYFFPRAAVRPFVGIGVGGGHTRSDYRSGGTSFVDNEVSLVLQGNAGAEFRIENLSLMLELKRYWHEPGDSGDFNATSTGLFGGVGFNW